ncbi:plasmid mobilization protein [Roseibium sp. MB-4]
MKHPASLKSEFSDHAAQPEKQPKAAASPVTLRLSNNERALLEEWAKGSSMSAYIRKCLFDDQETKRKKRRRPEPVADQKALAQVLGMLGSSRIANNLNQLAFHANSGTLAVDQDVIDKINEAYGHVCVLRTELLKALGTKRLDEWDDAP